jgi:uncharacterized membrane protein
MAITVDRYRAAGLHPLHAVLLASSLPLFLGALLADVAYSSTYQIQWTNFSSWLIAGGLVFAGLALLWAAIGLLRVDRVRRRGRLAFVGVLLATCVLGFINALVHARDAWASMPSGLVFSLIVLLLAVAATWLGYSTAANGDRR